VIPGQPPDLAKLPPGCSFYPRCAYREDGCKLSVPPAFERPGGGDFACFVDVDSVITAEERT
jgi:oligopeptide/dipeptide ABC transporter ATP-binding protein